MELNDLVKAIEEVQRERCRHGRSAAGGGSAAAPAAEEKTEFNVVLTDAGANKGSVIRPCAKSPVWPEGSQDLVGGARRPSRKAYRRPARSPLSAGRSWRQG